MAEIDIIIGSGTDEKKIKESGMLDLLNQVRVSWDLSIISAHRHKKDLNRHCVVAINEGTKVFIAAAGMSAALPGDVASTVGIIAMTIGVPLLSDDGFCGGLDSLLSTTRMPKGVSLLVSGVDKAGLFNAAISACQIVIDEETDLNRWTSLHAALQKLALEKPAKEKYLSSEQKEE